MATVPAVGVDGNRTRDAHEVELLTKKNASVDKRKAAEDAKNDAFKAAIKKELQYDRSDVEHGRSAYLSLKFAASGSVTVKGEFNIGGAVYKGSASATLVPLTEPDTTSNGAFTGEVCAYLPAKAGKFGGYFERLKVKWTGMAFLLDE